MGRGGGARVGGWGVGGGARAKGDGGAGLHALLRVVMQSCRLCNGARFPPPSGHKAAASPLSPMYE